MPSSTKVSAHTVRISSHLLTNCPARRTSASKRSNALGARRTVSPYEDKRRSSTATVNPPKEDRSQALRDMQRLLAEPSQRYVVGECDHRSSCVDCPPALLAPAVRALVSCPGVSMRWVREVDGRNARSGHGARAPGQQRCHALVAATNAGPVSESPSQICESESRTRNRSPEVISRRSSLRISAFGRSHVELRPSSLCGGTHRFREPLCVSEGWHSDILRSRTVRELRLSQEVDIGSSGEIACPQRFAELSSCEKNRCVLLHRS